MQDPKNQMIKKSLLSIRADLRLSLHEQTAFALRRKHFECGDKAGKMLALQLKQLESKQSILAIKSAEGDIINDQKIINQAFRDFYSKLYQSECSAQDHNLNTFLKNVSLPTLCVSQRDELDCPVTTSEVVSAIKALSSAKSPGGDGFTIEFYKCFLDVLSPLLVKLYTDMIENQTMPLSMRTATICIIYIAIIYNI